LCPTPDPSRLVRPVCVELSGRRPRQRCPSLSAGWNELPLFFANVALLRRDTARCILGAAGGANKRVHLTAPAICSMPLVIRHPARTSTPKLPLGRNLKCQIREASKSRPFGSAYSFKNCKQSLVMDAMLPLSKTCRASRSIGLAVVLLAAVPPGGRLGRAENIVSTFVADLLDAAAGEGAFRHLRVLQDIALMSGGNRAAGTP